MAGIYVHIPYCTSRCIYCDFYSTKRRDWEQYTEALIKEIHLRRDYLEGVPPETVYFGGGTPSILPSNCITAITDALSECFDLSNVKEFTLEANPDDITEEKCDLWHAIGVNRLSMGVQSFIAEHLEKMRRRHTAEQVFSAVGTLRSHGFDNISVDLIFGFSFLEENQWDFNISCALDTVPQHISCYQMMGRYASDDEESCLKQYLHLQRRLSEAGYHQYEISNYALEGFESRHNSAYWSRSPYLGLGAAAHSFDGYRSRCWNVSDIDRYMAQMEGRLTGQNAGSETLSDKEVFDEQIMLGLRRTSGLNLANLDRSLLDKKKPVLDRLVRTGDIIIEKSRIRIPAERLFISDSIISALFAD